MAQFYKQVVSKKELKTVCGIPYSAQHIARLEAAGKFPKRIRLGQNRVAWLLSEVEEWLDARILYPRVGFVVTNLSRPATRVVAFFNGRGTAEQWIKEGKNASKWTRLSCCSFAANAVRLQLHALVYNLANFLRTLALPDGIEKWSLTSLREKLVKIGAKLVVHGRYMTFQMAEVAVPRDLFRRILQMIDGLRPGRTSRC